MLPVSNLLLFGFIATTILCFVLAWRAMQFSRKFLVLSACWLVIQALVASSGFYQNLTAIPPRMFLTFGPPLVLIVYLLNKRKKITALRKFNQANLTLIHTVRIPVELILFGLFQAGTIPELMTFSGRNFDILAGLTAPFVYYFGFVKKRMSMTWIKAWNWISLALLINIIVNALLSAPLPFQQFAFDQPNIAILYFPFVWLPAFIVPVVLWAHLQVLWSKDGGE